MNLKGRKFRLAISSILPCDAEGIFDELSKTHALHYVGIYSIRDTIFICIHAKFVISGNNLLKIMTNLGFSILNIEKVHLFSGEMVSEKGKKLVHGGSRVNKRKATPPTQEAETINNSTTINNNDNRTINNNNINLIMVNPIGMESLEHITPEFIQELLAEHHGPDVVFRFGTKMYSLQENMNFKTDVKSGFISGRTDMDDAWETRRKNEGFSMLLDNLKDKNEEAVLKYLETIPHDDLDQFKRDMWWIYEHKNSGLQEDVPVYQKFIRDGFNLLTANIADKKRRIERDTGKKLKLV